MKTDHWSQKKLTNNIGFRITNIHYLIVVKKTLLNILDMKNLINETYVLYHSNLKQYDHLIYIYIYFFYRMVAVIYYLGFTLL